MVTIHVCIGTACHVKGGYNVINALQSLVRERKLAERVKVEAAFCLGQCGKAVSIRVDQGPVFAISEDNLQQFFEEEVASKLA